MSLSKTLSLPVETVGLTFSYVQASRRLSVSHRIRVLLSSNRARWVLLAAALRMSSGLSRNVAARVATSCLDDKGRPSKTRVSFLELIILIMMQQCHLVFMSVSCPWDVPIFPDCMDTNWAALGCDGQPWTKFRNFDKKIVQIFYSIIIF